MESNIIYECLLSNSVFYKVLNALSDDTFNRKCFMDKFFLSKKDTEKGVLFQVEGLIQIIVKFRAEKMLCFYAPNILLRGTKFCV